MAFTPPNKAPTVPILQGETLAILTLKFSTADITGVGSPISYQCIYGPDRAALEAQRNNQIVTGNNLQLFNIPSVNDECIFRISGLIVGQTYFFASRSINNVGYRTSLLSDGITITRDPTPSKAPTIPAVVGIATPANTTLTFSSYGITGDAPLTYNCVFGENMLSLNFEVSATLTGNNIYTVTLIDTLILGKTYFFASQVVNDFSTKRSLPTLGITIINDEYPPSMAPSVPVATIITPTSITVTFNVSGITGTLPLNYECYYSETPSGGDILAVTQVQGDFYSATANNLISGRSYYFQSDVYNAFGNNSSEFSGPITTYFKPASSPLPRVSGTPTSNSITVEFNVNGILGTPPFQYKCYYGTSIQTLVEVPIVEVSNFLYSASVIGLNSNTTYFFQTTTINDFGVTASAVVEIETDSSGTINPICYVEGTQLLTPHGYVSIEDLRVGDSLLTRGIIRDGMRFFPNPDKAELPSKIIWIGRFIVKNPDFYSFPIRIKKHALKNEVGAIPFQDLSVSPNHRIIINNITMSAKRLVNNTSIIIDTRKQPVIYYHVELSSHSVIVANGLLAESYLDTKNRHIFEVQQFAKSSRPEQLKLSFRR